jgi:acetyl-CoA carboxylase carboxyltransferase component
MIIANDATVKAGAFFPMTAKKVIRSQNIAIDNHIPTIYLVDSAGVFLPLQEDVFPDTDDFGRVFRNNAVMSAMGIPQTTAIMGMCVAGGAYLPVMCDHILMTEGSGLFLAGPALVQAAIGQVISAEELGGAKVHTRISGTIDFREPDDPSCIERIRALVDKMGHRPGAPFDRKSSQAPTHPAQDIYGLFESDLDGTTARNYRAPGGRQPFRGVSRQVRPDAAVRLCAHRGLGGRHRGQPEKARSDHCARHGQEADRVRGRDVHRVGREGGTLHPGL